MLEDEIFDHLALMLESTELIEKRFSRIQVPEDFVLSADGATILDAVSMRLQVIGESVRKFQIWHLQGTYTEAEKHPSKNALWSSIRWKIALEQLEPKMVIDKFRTVAYWIQSFLQSNSVW
jgi:hypothetical protein